MNNNLYESTKQHVSVNMRLISLLAFLSILCKSYCFADNKSVPSSVNLFSTRNIYLKVAKPIHINVSKHYPSYGILGPESFINYVTLKVLDNNGDTSITDKIVVGMNDSQATDINNTQVLEVYVRVSETWGEYPEFDSKVYRLISIVDKSEFLKYTGGNDLNRGNMVIVTQFQLKIKSKPVSSSITTMAKLPLNDSIEKDTIVNYEVLELADSLSIAVFGKEIKVIKSDRNFDSNLPYCWITVKRSGLKTDNGLSKEIIYEVISVVPVRE